MRQYTDKSEIIIEYNSIFQQKALYKEMLNIVVYHAICLNSLIVFIRGFNHDSGGRNIFFVLNAKFVFCNVKTNHMYRFSFAFVLNHMLCYVNWQLKLGTDVVRQQMYMPIALYIKH